MPERKVRIIRRAVKALASATQSPNDSDGQSLSDTVPDAKTPLPEEAIFSEAETQSIQKMLGRLEDREANILRMRFGLDGTEPMTLKEIGEHNSISLTRERVRQLESDALRKLNEMMDD